MKTISKLQMMSMVLKAIHHESFEHSTMGVFDVTLTRAWAIDNLEPVLVYLKDIIPFIMENRVTEPARVMQLKDVSWRVDPGITIQTGPDEYLMIDGHHRALRRNIEGEEDMLMYIVPLDKAIRPAPGWVRRDDVDWGDPIINGVIQRGGRNA